MKEDIIVLHSRDVRKALSKVANRPFAWLYLGQDIKQREDISHVLGRANRCSIGGLLQDIAYKEKQPFLDFIAELGLRQKNKRHWWASNVAYRCPLTNDLFLLWCYAAVFDEVCSGEKWGDGKWFLVLVEDCWLYRHLWQRCQKNGSHFRFMSRKSVVPELLGFIVKGIATRGYFLLKTGWQIWQTRNLIRPRKEREVYIYSWIFDDSFKKNEKFESPYFGRLPQFISSNGLSVAYITPLFISPTLRGKCLTHGESTFVFLDEYISLWSLIRSLFPTFSITSFTNSPLKILLLREMAGEFSSSSLARNILQYYAFKRCLKEMKQKRITIIYPFENQPWEKMLCLAAKELGKDIKLVGYQHSMVPLALLNYFLGAGEANSTPLPDLIVTNGEYTLNLLRNAGYGETKFINGGALRYERLHEMSHELSRREREPKTVLVALPYLSSLAEEMWLVIFNAFKDLAGEKYRFMIKFHPTAPRRHLGIQPLDWPAHFQKTGRPLSEIFKEVDLVVYSSSTVGLEALLNGVPVVKYYSEHVLNLDPLDAFDEGVVKSCSEDNFKQVVLSALSEGGNYLVQETALSANNVNRFFSPVNEDVWRQIVRS